MDKNEAAAAAQMTAAEPQPGPGPDTSSSSSWSSAMTTSSSSTFKNPLPLDIPEIIQCVFNYLSSQSLKSCREVSSFWNQNALKILDRRILNDQDPFQISLNNAPIAAQDELGALRTCLTRAEPIPSCNFVLNTVALASHEIQTLLQTYNVGTRVRGLTLEVKQPLLYQNESLIQLLRTLLVDQVPNLRVLTLVFNHGMDFEDSNSHPKLFSPTESGRLPNLRKLCVKNLIQLNIGGDVILEIVGQAVNPDFEFEATNRKSRGPMQPRVRERDLEVRATARAFSASASSAPTASVSVSVSVGVGPSKHVFDVGNESQSRGRWITADFVNELVAMGRLGALKTVSFAPSLTSFGGVDLDGEDENTYPMPYTSLSKLTKLSKCKVGPGGLQIRRLVTNLDQVYGCVGLYGVTTKLLQRILTGSQKSLQCLVMEPLEFLDTLEFPVLPAVTHLYLHSTLQGRIRILPPRPDRQLCNVLPNLKMITTDPNLSLMEEAFEYFFVPGPGSGPPVPTLEEFRVLTNFFQLTAFDGIGAMFPNLSSLLVHPSPSSSSVRGRRTDLPQLIRKVVQCFPNLKTLKLRNFRIHAETEVGLKNFVYQLDSALTGVSVAEWKNSGVFGVSPTGGAGGAGAVALVPHARTGPSLLDLPDLDYLRIDLHVGMWSKFIQNSTSSPTLLSFAAPRLQTIGRVKFGIFGDLKRGEFGMTSRQDFSGVKLTLAAAAGGFQGHLGTSKF